MTYYSIKKVKKNKNNKKLNKINGSSTKLTWKPPKFSCMIPADVADPLTGLALKGSYKPSPCLCLHTARIQNVESVSGFCKTPGLQFFMATQDRVTIIQKPWAN